MQVHNAERRRVSTLRQRNASDQEKLKVQCAWLVFSFLTATMLSNRLGITISHLVLDVIIMISAQPVYKYVKKRYNQAWNAAAAE